jgi:hypothetical protein
MASNADPNLQAEAEARQQDFLLNAAVKDSIEQSSDDSDVVPPGLLAQSFTMHSLRIGAHSFRSGGHSFRSGATFVGSWSNRSVMECYLNKWPVWHRAPSPTPFPFPLSPLFRAARSRWSRSYVYSLTLLLLAVALALLYLYEIKVFVLVLTQPRDACSLHCLLQADRQCISTDPVMTSSAPMNASPNASVTSVNASVTSVMTASARRGPLRDPATDRGRRVGTFPRPLRICMRKSKK